MSDTLYIGNVSKGLVNNRTAFNIDNDAFSKLYNAYSWRGRVKRKRGTTYLGRLQIQTQLVADPFPWQDLQITLHNSQANLLGSLISGITQASNAVVSTFGGIITVGDIVQITGVQGMTQINNSFYTVVSETSTTTTVDVSSLAFSPYTSGGSISIAGINVVPGSINLTIGGQVYTDPFPQNGSVTGSSGGTGSINYATGLLTINGGGSSIVTGDYSYYPSEPVMGLENFINPQSISPYPELIAFDTTKAFQFFDAGKYFYNVTFYKISKNPFIWYGEDFEQFWSTNYSGAFWATNGRPGFNYLNGTYASGSGTANVTFNFKSGGNNFTTLVLGDRLFFNEWPSGSTNGITGIVSNITGGASGNYVVSFFVGDSSTPMTVVFSSTGIVQMLTNSLPGQDGIKWYDGDPTDATGFPTSGTYGWVNFAPPLTAAIVSINNFAQATYYLVGALMIYSFKDRLLFFSPYIQQVGGTPILLKDTVIWSWNGTPYYCLPIPANQTFDIKSYYVDQTGLGGYLSSGLDQNIITLSFNQDVLLIGFTATQTRFVYTGDDINPFLFFGINYEFGSFATFSEISLDKGALTIGQYGIVMTDQQSTQRIDLDIPDEVFQIKQTDNGAARINAVRDFYREWISFTYPTNVQLGTDICKFPTRTFFYNYREGSWAIFKESFTTQGTYRSSTGFTWETVPYPTWNDWNTSWDSGFSYADFPSIIGGNSQGYVLIKDEESTSEAPSGDIKSITNETIYSFDHCVEEGDFIYITGCIGMQQLNGKVSEVLKVIDSNNFVIDNHPEGVANITNISTSNPCVITAQNRFLAGDIVIVSGVVGMTELNGNMYNVISANSTTVTINVDSTAFVPYFSGGIVTPLYFGSGVFARLSVPDIKTKQFNPYWEQGRQVRMQSQKYLFDYTETAEVTSNIYLNQDDSDPWNDPDVADIPNGLVYSQTVYTCPESTNLGLTPANANLQSPTAHNQQQIWHRMNTSLLGDTFQISITLSDAQMKDPYLAQAEVTLHAIQITVNPSSLLA